LARPGDQRTGGGFVLVDAEVEVEAGKVGGLGAVAVAVDAAEAEAGAGGKYGIETAPAVLAVGSETVVPVPPQRLLRFPTPTVPACRPCRLPAAPAPNPAPAPPCIDRWADDCWCCGWCCGCGCSDCRGCGSLRITRARLISTPSVTPTAKRRSGFMARSVWRVACGVWLRYLG
jgi:hypothetical protein